MSRGENESGDDASGAPLRLALETHEFEESVLADEREAGALGVGGVPAFVADGMAALSGVQSVGNLKRLVEHVRAPASAS